jgi:hypothetical protein
VLPPSFLRWGGVQRAILMIEDGMRIDAVFSEAARIVPLRPRNHAPAAPTTAHDADFERKVIALADRLKPRLFNQDVLDLLPVAADDAWLQRIGGLRRLGPPQRRKMLRPRPANDRGRRNRDMSGMSVSLRGLATALVAFGGGLALAGFATAVTRSDLALPLTSLLH